MNRWLCQTKILLFTRNLYQEPDCPMHTNIKRCKWTWNALSFSMSYSKSSIHELNTFSLSYNHSLATYIGSLEYIGVSRGTVMKRTDTVSAFRGLMACQEGQNETSNNNQPSWGLWWGEYRKLWEHNAQGLSCSGAYPLLRNQKITVLSKNYQSNNSLWIRCSA